MKLVYVYDGIWPRGATRVKKQVSALESEGHSVLLLTRGVASKESAPTGTVKVRGLPRVGPTPLASLLSFPFFGNPLWWAHILMGALQWKADAIVVEDLPLAPTAIVVARLLGVPLYYDMGEVYPEFLSGMWQFGNPRIVDRIVRNPSAAQALERWVLARASHTFVVSEESRTRAIARGANAEQITVVGNTPENHRALGQTLAPPDELRSARGRQVVVFTGILIFDRGVTDAVRAIDLVRHRLPEVLFVVVGDGPAMEDIRAEVRRLELTEHVWLLGWKDHASLPAYYQAASVGLLPFLDGGQIRFTLANKLFDYMGAGLPVIASDVPPMRRILAETRAGLVVPASSPAKLAEAIVTVLELPESERTAMGALGSQAVASRYNWTQDRKRFVAAFRAGHEEHHQEDS